MPPGCTRLEALNSMWAAHFIARKALTVVLAVVIAFAIEPVAVAMPAHHAATMQGMNCNSPAMKCHQEMLKKERGAPCKNMAKCFGMLNGAPLTAISQSAPVVVAPARTANRTWRINSVGPGITLGPDYPPPIT